MVNTLQPITISARAIAAIKKIMSAKNISAAYGLRVGIKGSGCGGAMLLLGFDKQRETDLVYTISDITVYVDKKHVLYVIDKEVDYYQDEQAQGFMFSPTKNSKPDH